MKYKRVLSLILAVVLLTSLFVGITGTASAADSSSIITHTVKSGEYLYKICQNYGLTYSVCKSAIMLLNGFTSETQLNRIYAGQALKLPASDALALTVKQEVTIGSSSSSSSSSSGTTTGDTIVYYLVSYTVKSGDTLVNICNSLGSNYSKYANTILTINGLTSVTRIYAGKTLYIPVDSKPTSGTYYSVVSHKVTSGETITSICSSYGVNYSTNTSLVQGLNSGVNLNAIKVGQTILVPSTRTTSSSGTTPSTTGENAISIATKSSSADAGSPYATVNGNTVTKAASGTTVVIKGGSSTSSVLSIVSVQRADTKATISFDASADSFVMPNCAVVVTVQYSNGYAINKNVSGGHGSFETYVNDAVVSFAASGRKVTVKTSPNTGYIVDTVTVKKSSGSTIAVSKSTTNSYYFTMPEDDVTVTVKYKEAVYYKIQMTYNGNAKSCNYGTATCKVDGVTVGKNGVAEGTVVTVEGSPVNGYGVSEVWYIYKSSSSADEKKEKATLVSGNTWTFEMPAMYDTTQSVTVNVIFERTDQYNIITNLACNYGSVKYRVLNKTTGKFGEFTTTAKYGDTVAIVVNNEKWWPLSISSITYANGTAKITTSTDTTHGGKYTVFTMPGASVTVSTSISEDDINRFSIYHDPASSVSFRTYRSDDTETETFVQGEKVIFKPVGYSEDAATFYIYDGTNYNKITGNSITMQGNDVAIKAVLSNNGTARVTAEHASGSSTLGTVRVLSNDVEVANTNDSSGSDVYTGSKLTFSVTEGTDEDDVKYYLSKLEVAIDGKANEDITKTYGSGYTLPTDAKDKNVRFIATFKAQNQYDITQKVIDGGSGCTVTVASVANAGSAVSVSATAVSGYTLQSLTVDGTEITMTKNGTTYTGSFDMPSHNAELVATFTNKCTVSVPDSAEGVERVFITGQTTYAKAKENKEAADESRSIDSGSKAYLFMQMQPAYTTSTHNISVTVNGTEYTAVDTTDVDAKNAGYGCYVEFTLTESVKPTIKVTSKKVNAPVITPASGTAMYTNQTVTITADAGLKIYYTTDGTTPEVDNGTPKGTTKEYTAGNPITPEWNGDASKKVQAIAVGSTGTLPSDVVSAEYNKIKVDSPTITLEKDKPSTGITTVTITCSNAENIYYDIGAGQVLYNSPIEVYAGVKIQAQGKHTYATDSDIAEATS